MALSLHMADDLPDISQDPNVPLPTVDPNSALVPYRMSSQAPGGQPVVTTGYGPRARPPIQPPAGFGGGVGMPDLDRIYQAAFSKLPVDEAIKAVDAATKYVSYRGFRNAAAQAKTPEEIMKAWVTYAPGMLKGSATGVPEAFKAQQQATEVPRVFPGGTTFGGRFYPNKEPTRPPQPAASIQLVNAIQEADDNAAAATKNGNSDEANRWKARAQNLRDQAKGQEVVTGYDDQGRPIVKVGKGVSSDATVATASAAQQNLVKFKTSLGLMNDLEKVFRPEHVGVRGVVGELAVDKGLQQVAEALGMPDVANKDRIDSRKLIIALRERLMRETSDGSRFNLADRQEISAALPSSGIFESGQNATRSLGVVRNVLKRSANNYARSIGRPPPLWTLSPTELKQRFPTAKELAAAAKQGQIDRQDAEDAMVENY